MKTVLSSIRWVCFALTLSLGLMTACQKDENFLTGIDNKNESGEAIGMNLQDTLNWLEDKMTDMVINEDWKNEQFNPTAQITGSQKVWIQMPFADDPIQVEAEIIDGHYILEGDIIVDTESNWRDHQERAQERGSAHSFSSLRWPGGVIPFVIESGHPISGRIEDAIDNLNSGTNLTIKPRTNETDYIKFVSASGCASWVGRQGGEQTINASSNCSVGNMMHEILHAAGLWHEQSRCDRNSFVRILWDNITEGKEKNFGQHCNSLSNPGTWDEKDGIDIGNYDFGSIMHYPSTAFSSNGKRTILPKGISKYQVFSRLALMGQRSSLSSGDATAINRLYPVKANTYYSIRLRHSGKVWDLPGGNSKTGTSIQQYSYIGNYNQQFKFVPQKDGSYRIISRKSGHSLEVAGGSTTNYKALQQHKYWGGLHQKFEIKHVSGNYFTIWARHSKKALQTKYNNLGNGSVVHQYTYNGNTYQQVTFIRH